MLSNYFKDRNINSFVLSLKTDIYSGILGTTFITVKFNNNIYEFGEALTSSNVGTAACIVIFKSKVYSFMGIRCTSLPKQLADSNSPTHFVHLLGILGILLKILKHSITFLLRNQFSQLRNQSFQLLMLYRVNMVALKYEILQHFLKRYSQ